MSFVFVVGYEKENTNDDFDVEKICSSEGGNQERSTNVVSDSRGCSFFSGCENEIQELTVGMVHAYLIIFEA